VLVRGIQNNRMANSLAAATLRDCLFHAMAAMLVLLAKSFIQATQVFTLSTGPWKPSLRIARFREFCR
jgi:hypothetical protein